MQLKLVYRALRKISDWVVSGCYSDGVYVGGEENVPSRGPVLVSSFYRISSACNLSMTYYTSRTSCIMHHSAWTSRVIDTDTLSSQSSTHQNEIIDTPNGCDSGGSILNLHPAPSVGELSHCVCCHIGLCMTSAVQSHHAAVYKTQSSGVDSSVLHGHVKNVIAHCAYQIWFS
jgi:hypothetical protein